MANKRGLRGKGRKGLTRQTAKKTVPMGGMRSTPPKNPKAQPTR